MDAKYAVPLQLIKQKTTSAIIMKRLFLLLFILSAVMNAKAWEVGDWFTEEATGMPVLVIYVDQSGEHGLLMAPSGGYTTQKVLERDIKNIQNYKKKNDKMMQKITRSSAIKHNVDVTYMDEYIAQADKLFDAVIAWLPNMPLLSGSKVSEKEERQMLRNIAPEMTGNGLHDQQLIIDYCEQNNVNMSYYFYSIDWCRQLGEGWFIPGNEELELYASSFSKGLGVHMTLKEAGQANAVLTWKRWMLHSVFPFSVRSSTFTECPWEDIGNNKGKTATIIGRNDLDFQDNYYVLGQGGTFGDIFYALVRNNQCFSHIVAFKYF